MLERSCLFMEMQDVRSGSMEILKGIRVSISPKLSAIYL